MKALDTLYIGIASDHAGYEMKERLKEYFAHTFFALKDFGTHSEESVDYPDYIHPLAQAVAKNEIDFGIAICGSGNGVSIVANKHKNVRAALCWTDEIAILARKHNDANIISLPARFISQALAEDMVERFLTTDFEGGRHCNRVNKINE
ncbi:MAG: ribose 5-phosphate isomerase B [Paludibacteraceae bacterium]|jgi:ribose 5-phosphate isomerase B|nr:ribose 5-phosphate isomerase B [Paludibacteraceae bacterium]MBP6436179.1 ribose 5-phosphate isomerase B [Paludibacteraceae bacterium]MBP7218889.1 ribose 5-phosphate isomerase B [Paludibacteraceae bacterium]MBP8627545.1 ribose 5-phosphate isomerase B [Paludibacteraceae bacterium]MBP8782169.1 ribose 5-phosphate isomerase B [Paludibacteraceae bacterium]